MSGSHMAATPDAAIDPFTSSSISAVTRADHTVISPPTPPASHTTFHTSTDPDEDSNRSKLTRPRLTQRKSSGSMIIPRDAPTEAPPQEFPPDDARAMSPRRSSEETEKMLLSARLSIEK
ncbi:MAG: hypothetical protein Q9196_003076 [Gyalolechia fulgens]